MHQTTMYFHIFVYYKNLLSFLSIKALYFHFVLSKTLYVNYCIIFSVVLLIIALKIVLYLDGIALTGQIFSQSNVVIGRNENRLL